MALVATPRTAPAARTGPASDQAASALRDPGSHWLWGTVRRFIPYYRSALLAALLSNTLMLVTGTVTSDKNEQTITVLVERRFKHPLLQKTVRKSKKYRAHDAENKFKVGDTVRIEECAPISKTKRWTVVVEA